MARGLTGSYKAYTGGGGGLRVVAIPQGLSNQINVSRGKKLLLLLYFLLRGGECYIQLTIITEF